MLDNRITVDDRAGSREFARWFPDCKIERLDSADFAWLSWDKRRVGVERKALGDLLQSWKDGRLVQHQVPLLQEQYDYAYLLVEGELLPDGRGHLIYNHGAPVYYANLVKFLASLDLAGLRVIHSAGAMSTAITIMALHDWWQKEEHSSLKEIKRPRVKVQAPTLKQAWLRALPGVGTKTLEELDPLFPRACDLGDLEMWKGVRPALANKCVRAIWEEA